MTHVANVTIDSTEVAADLTDYPVYVDLSDLPASFWSTVASGGGDIRCYKSDGTTELAREVVSCDTTAETGELHILYSGTLSSSVDTVIQIHADGSSSDYAAGATYGRNAVWGDYSAVWHMADVSDSTGNGNTLTAFGSPSIISGSIGSAYELNGSTQYLQAADSSSLDLDLTGDIEISAVFSSTINPSVGQAIVDKSIGNDDAYRVLALGFGKLRFRSAADGANSDSVTSYITDTPTWFTATGDGENVRLWLQGNYDGPQLQTLSASANNDPLSIGAAVNGSGNFFDGYIDEVRIKSGSRNDSNWIATEYVNQSGPGTFYAATDPSPGGTSVTANDITQIQTIDNVTLTQANVLAVNSMAHGQTIDAAALTQQSSITLQDLTQSQTVDNATLTQAGAIAVNSIEQGQTIDQITLTQAHVLVAADMTQAQAIDEITLLASGTLSLDAVSQSQTIDNATLTQANVLAVNSLSQGQTIDEALLTIAGVISIDGVTQAQVLDALELIQANVLAPNGVTQSQSVDNATVSAAGFTLNPDDITQSQAIDGTTLTQYHVLAVDGLTQAQAIDIALFGGLVIGSLNGQVVVYAAMGGNVYVIPDLSGTIH
jgi:hypothetical protein